METQHIVVSFTKIHISPELPWLNIFNFIHPTTNEIWISLLELAESMNLHDRKRIVSQEYYSDNKKPLHALIDFSSIINKPPYWTVDQPFVNDVGCYNFINKYCPSYRNALNRWVTVSDQNTLPQRGYSPVDTGDLYYYDSVNDKFTYTNILRNTNNDNITNVRNDTGNDIITGNDNNTSNN